MSLSDHPAWTYLRNEKWPRLELQLLRMLAINALALIVLAVNWLSGQ